ncbi:hypothetical protein EDB80DRAFT_591987 [Ilyonectria destructans]|nr:hypothetical protein EDB80DRAFT_591987 [Ilyonectria destructans]
MDGILTASVPGSIVVLESMPQRLEVKHSGDDWTGVTSPSERRKRQNRLHQRAYRMSRPMPTPGSLYPASEGVDNPVPFQNGEMDENDGGQDSAPQEGHLLLPTPESRAVVQKFTQRACEDYEQGAPRLEHLYILVRLNVLAAIARNATLLGFMFEGLCSPELVSPFNQQGPDFLSSIIPSQPFLGWLRPTALQVTVRHHPWIDLIPIPRMRDNILRALRDGLLDNKTLGLDVLNVEDFHGDAACLIVWGESWDPKGWEASVPFLRKWGGLMEGCSTLLEATNSWRHKRGEKKITL